MPMRLRPTFLLRLAVLLACLVVFLGLCVLLGWLWWSPVTLLVLVGLYLLTFEFEVLPNLIGAWLARRASRTGTPRPHRTLWFVDLDQAAQAADEYRARVRNNPTLW